MIEAVVGSLSEFNAVYTHVTAPAVAELKLMPLGLACCGALALLYMTTPAQLTVKLTKFVVVQQGDVPVPPMIDDVRERDAVMVANHAAKPYR
jgi:hypothetical protein